MDITAKKIINLKVKKIYRKSVIPEGDLKQ